jgi:hypothetical protein
MNSSSIFLVLLILFSLGLSIFGYWRTIPEIPKLSKRILTFLRWLGLSILFFLLFEPILELSSVLEQKPKTLIFLDDSESMNIESANLKLKQDYIQSIQNSGIQSLENSEILRFGNEPLLISKDSITELNTEDESTDFEKLFINSLRQKDEENLQSIVIFSDGNFNSGRNPIYAASELGLPVYTVTVGDTSQKSDVLIENILTNKIAYNNSAVPVNVTIKSSNYNLDSVNIKLIENGKEINSQKINLKDDKEYYYLQFEYVPNSPGSKKIEVVIDELPRENSTKNNSKIEFIKVLDNKKQIAFFAGSPSYDVSIISSIIDKDPNADINKFIQKKGVSFYREPSDAELKSSQMFVFVGFPNQFTSKQLLEKIRNEIAKGKPYLFVFSQNLDVKNLAIMKSILPFEVISEGKKEFAVLPVANERNISNPILRITGNESDIDNWNELSPLYKTETFLKLNPGAKSLLDIAVNNTILNEPLLIQSSSNGIKSIILTGYGLHKWKLASHAANLLKGKESIDLSEKLIENSMKWLNVKEQARKFSIKTNKQEFISGETVVLNAEVYDDSYQAIDNALVTANLIDNDSTSREIILSSIGNGKYISRLEGLLEGSFKIEANAKLNKDVLGSDETRFEVGNLNIEFLNLTANVNLMEQLANSTGGKNYFYSDVENLIKDLKSNSKEPKKIVNESIINIWEKIWLLATAILVFSLEWFYRKRLSML